MSFYKRLLAMPLFCCAIATAVAQPKQVANYTTNKTVIAKGEALFQKNCATCHNFKTRGIGPNLSGVTDEAGYTYLSKFITNSQALVKAKDKRALAVFAEYKVPMPAHPQLTATDINAILSYINTFKKQAEVYVNTAHLGAAVTNPIEAKIAKGGLTLKLSEWLTAPRTSAKNPATRITQTGLLKGPKGTRLLMLEMRGKLYEIKDGQFNVVMDITQYMPNFIPEPGLASGWGSFAFHPEFYKNGLLYTTHTEKKGSAPADFAYADSIPVALQWVVTEWKIKDPDAAVFDATPREMLRVNMPSPIHGMQHLLFNPLAKPGTEDYGLLYLGIGDGGSAEARYPQLCDEPTQIRSSIIRINPAGRNSKNGKYGIVASNPWAKDKDENTLGEVYARGFRNPNKITWAPDGTMLASEIGYTMVEELNIIKPGLDYGWPEREGTFVLHFSGGKSAIYNLLANDDPRYTYPVIQYDHDEGNAISGGFVYNGNIAALKGKYIFGDIVKGRIFYVDLKELKLGKQAGIKEFDLLFEGQPNSFVKLVKNSKADLRMDLGENNTIYIWGKTDGKIWEVKDCTAN